MKFDFYEPNAIAVLTDVNSRFQYFLISGICNLDNISNIFTVSWEKSNRYWLAVAFFGDWKIKVFGYIFEQHIDNNYMYIQLILMNVGKCCILKGLKGFISYNQHNFCVWNEYVVSSNNYSNLLLKNEGH